ncbi:MAG: hypothetical protein NZV14_03950 [Bryobacteraceae bacterium]|nr:hypothetical protein [Bryobacteraceae bacterium]MDW8377285.1 hypothetical protein [Bryobacterales bacterium]
MTRQLVLGLILVTSAAQAGIWPFKKEKVHKSAASPAVDSKAVAQPAQGFDSVYTQGTVAMIPQLTPGKLDLSDRQTLRFQFGKPVWSLPYKKISSIEVYDKFPPELFKMPFVHKKKRVFTLHFESERGKQRVEFEMGLEAAASVLPLLEERSGRVAFVEGQKDAESAWTDRYWKTAANAHKWEEAASGNAKVMTASKEE